MTALAPNKATAGTAEDTEHTERFQRLEKDWPRRGMATRNTKRHKRFRGLGKRLATRNTKRHKRFRGLGPHAVA